MKNTTNKDISPPELERLLREAALREGACVPETRQELEVLEERFAGKTVVLPKFSELLARLRGRTAAPTNIIKAASHFDQEVIEDLAMAARNGGEVPAEIRGKMDVDRANAEARKEK
jgi:phage terminase small subunit